MSNALAIAAVTATLRSLIEAGIGTDPSIAGVTVTTRPLDIARDNTVTNQVNLFLYHTMISSAWRNMDIPRTVAPGSHDYTPLPLTLYYLLTAYRGTDEDGAIANGRLEGSNRLLGLAMLALHDHALLDADAINAALPVADQVDFPFRQVERVRISPYPISIDEMSKLWSAFQTEYRMSVAYEVSVVLIESTLPKRAALPVLRRGAQDRGAFVVPTTTPGLFTVDMPHGKPSASLGDALTIDGDNLIGDGLSIQFRHTLLPAPLALIPDPDHTAQRVTVHLPDPAVTPAARSAWAAGIYLVTAVIQRAGLPPWTSNAVPIGLAPHITGRNPAAAPAGTVAITITCSPQIRSGQRVVLLFGEREIEPTAVTTPASPTAETTLTFSVPNATAGAYALRLRVEGVDSIPVDFTAVPPQFDANQIITIT